MNELFIGQHVIVRTYSAGVFAGTLVAREGREAHLTDARRIWYWEGAASLSQLAMEGVSMPENCKFAMPVDAVLVIETIEIIPTTAKSRASIEAVPAWKA